MRRLAVDVETKNKNVSINTASLVSRASRAFFEIGQETVGKTLGITAPSPPSGPPPVVFREKETGLLHVVYREVVVRFKPGTTKKMQETILKDRGFKIRRRNPFVPHQVVVYDPERRHTGEKLLEVANEWTNLDETVFATPNFVSQYRREAPPSIRAEEWHLNNKGGGGALTGEDVEILQAWKRTTGRKEIVIAVLDDGVDIEHPNLRTRIWKNPDIGSPDKNGRDFFLPEENPEHFNPRPKLFRYPYHVMTGNDIHGTPCAGVIAAIGRKIGSINGSVGAAPGCRILPVKIFHADELARDEAVADAIRYAALNADILSCSWSGGFSADLEQALEDAGEIGRNGLGAAIFCAAGNDGRNFVGYPARDPNAIAVGASTDQGKLAGYSNFGPEIAFVAPSSGGTRGIFTTDVSIPNRGFNIGSANQGGVDGLHTNSFGGTSSATPLAAAVAALVLSIRPNLNRSALRDLLAGSADKIGDGYDERGHSQEFGFGRINAARAIQAALALT
ncbi:MAG: S8 family serine peptidase [Acidobacteriota bacterium]|nr:S8 family serine peptidase [Acidobacteriota bacterium]